MYLRTLFLITTIIATASVQAAPLVSQSGNLLANGSFESGSFDEVVGHSIASAADYWHQWSNSGGTLTTELITASEMMTTHGTDVIDGEAALRINTEGAGDGGFTFDTFGHPGWITTNELTISAWVYVISGEMGLFLGANHPGNFTYTASTTTGAWELLTLTRAAGQVNEEPLLYSINGPAEFIVDAIWLNYGGTSANPSTGVPTPAGLMLLGLGLLLAGLRRVAR